MDWSKFRLFFKFTKKTKGINPLILWSDIIFSSYKYNISLIDYFIFRFYEKSKEEREKWVGTGYKYEYDLIMNPKQSRHLVENKLEFYNAYAPFVKHANCSIDDLIDCNKKANEVYNNLSGKVVVKDALGQCGWDVEILESKNFTIETLVSYMQKKGFNLAEAFVEQHQALSQLSPSGLNTIRVITQLNKNNEVDMLGARLRISVNSHVDNLASGNIAAPIDLETGKISGPAVYSDITRQSVTHHPITGIEIVGFQVPLWDMVIDLSKKAALHRIVNRSIGWDVAITNSGPELIEGNHNWCKILWQLPVNEGLKKILEAYLK